MTERSTMNDVTKIENVLGSGYIDEQKANEVLQREPEAASRILLILEQLRQSQDWVRFNTFINLAVWLNPGELGKLLVSVLKTRPYGLNVDDVVEILGEVREPDAISEISKVFEERWPSEDPGHSFSIKCIIAINDISGEDADKTLRGIATGNYPNVLKWHAAEELDITEELGFDEEEMLSDPTADE